MSTLFSPDLIDGLVAVGAISFASAIVCPLIFWALTVPIHRTNATAKV